MKGQIPAERKTHQTRSVTGVKIRQVIDRVSSCETYYNATDARRSFSSIIERVSKTGQCVAIGVRNKPTVTIQPIGTIEGDRETYEHQMARMITAKLLRHAPLYIKKPSIEELSRLTKEQLVAFMDIEDFSLSPDIREKVLAKLGDPVILDRLEKRRRIADSLEQAAREGLYEASEHATGMLTCE